jgi:hypothetical protein
MDVGTFPWRNQLSRASPLKTATFQVQRPSALSTKRRREEAPVIELSAISHEESPKGDWTGNRAIRLKATAEDTTIFKHELQRIRSIGRGGCCCSRALEREYCVSVRQEDPDSQVKPDIRAENATRVVPRSPKDHHPISNAIIPGARCTRRNFKLKIFSITHPSI